jgi:hypothetical protein
MSNPRYLVRPGDYTIYELDDSNNCYRYLKPFTYSDGTRAQAQSNFTFENVTNYAGFFPIDEEDIPIYKKKHDDYMEFIAWHCRPDGHGSSKGGSKKEFKKRKRCGTL